MATGDSVGYTNQSDKLAKVLLHRIVREISEGGIFLEGKDLKKKMYHYSTFSFQHGIIFLKTRNGVFKFFMSQQPEGKRRLNIRFDSGGHKIYVSARFHELESDYIRATVALLDHLKELMKEEKLGDEFLDVQHLRHLAPKPKKKKPA